MSLGMDHYIFEGWPCIRLLRLRYERRSKPWCPVGVLRNALGATTLLRLKLQYFSVCKQKQEFIATEA